MSPIPERRNGRNGSMRQNGYFLGLFDYALRHRRISVDQARRLTGAPEDEARRALFEISARTGCLLYAGNDIFGIPDESARYVSF